MLTTPRQPQPAQIGTIVLFTLACLLYLGMFAILSDSNGADPATRGLGTAFASMFGFALWLVLAILLLLAAAAGAMPKWAGIAAVILLPLSGVAAFIAANTDGEKGGWPILVPLLIPLPIALYALWARLPALHRAMPAGIASAAAWGIVILLGAAPLARGTLDALPDAARDQRIAQDNRERQEKTQREEQEARGREEAKFAALNPDSPLRGYVEYLATGDSRFRQAVAGARQVKSRQSDIAGLLKDGRIVALQEMWRLDLAATPELCAAYGSALRTEASKINKTRSDYLSVAMDLERQMPNIKWLGGVRCDLSPALTVLEANVRAVSDSPRMDQFADSVAALKMTP